MDNYFSSPDVYNDLTKQKINFCSAVWPNRKEMPDDFRSKELKLCDVRVRTSGDMTAGVWKDKCIVHMLTNMYDPPAEANFCDLSGSAPKPEIVNIKINTWGTPIKVTEWRTATPSVIIHINGRRNCSFTSSASQSSTARLCLRPVLLNYHTETSGWHMWGIW